MFMRMLCDAYLLDSTSQGAPGIDYVRWKKPVLAGDTTDYESVRLCLERASAVAPGFALTDLNRAAVVEV